MTFLGTLKNQRILLTGASGWIGQEFLCLLQQEFGKLEHLDLTCTASKRKTIFIHGEPIECQSLCTISNSEGYDLIVHLAFVLPNPSKALHEEEYREINRDILSFAKVLFDRNQNALKLIMSSGAVANRRTLANSDLLKAYSLLKKNMESLLADSNSLVVRLWSATGHHMPLNSHYALADFINKARVNEDIFIRSNVLRSYVSIPEMLKVALMDLYKGKRGVVNSGGSAVTLAGLANIIVRSMNSNSLVSVEDIGFDSKLDYVSPKSELISNNSMHLSSIEVQISQMLKEIYKS
jgi:nucleoside-diphosphate-sugar epimerase